MKRFQVPFFKRFSTVGGIAFTLVILVSHLYYANQTKQVLHQRLQEKALFINNFLAYTFSTALLLKDDVSLLQVIDQLEKDPDVLSVVVVDDQGQIRYSVDQNKIGEEVDNPDMKKVFASNEPIMTNYFNAAGEALELVAPLKVQGRNKPLGLVRIDMTYKGIDEKIQHARDSFLMYALGIFMFGMTLTGTALNIWVARPLHLLKQYLRMIGPSSAEPALPEGSDDLGQLNAAVNELILKFRSELQNQAMMQGGMAMQDSELIRQLFTALEPDSRLVLANRENLIVTDTDPSASTLGAHLLDLMQDEAFGILVGKAFETIGQPAKGLVVLNEQPYTATVLHLQETFSKGIRTLILLNKNKETPTQ